MMAPLGKNTNAMRLGNSAPAAKAARGSMASRRGRERAAPAPLRNVRRGRVSMTGILVIRGQKPEVRGQDSEAGLSVGAAHPEGFAADYGCQQRRKTEVTRFTLLHDLVDRAFVIVLQTPAQGVG